jgi:hypothetical protein
MVSGKAGIPEEMLPLGAQKEKARAVLEIVKANHEAGKNHLTRVYQLYQDPEQLYRSLGGKNLMENPQDPKFKKLKLDNKAFQSRIAPYEGAVEFLDVMGFEKKADCLEQRKSIPDGWLCGNALKFIDLILGQI